MERGERALGAGATASAQRYVVKLAIGPAGGHSVEASHARACRRSMRRTTALAPAIRLVGRQSGQLKERGASAVNTLSVSNRTTGPTGVTSGVAPRSVYWLRCCCNRNYKLVVPMTDTFDSPRSRGVAGAPHISPVTPAEDIRSIALNRISWGAVLAGAVVALVAQLILNLIGVGVGASTFDPGAGASENPSAQGFSIGAAMWWTVSGIVASFIGGLVAGRLSGKPKESTAGWHGLSAWAVTTLIVFYLLGSAIGGVVGGAYQGLSSLTGGVASAVGTAAQTAAPSLAKSADPFSSIEQSIRGVAGTNDPKELREAAISAVRAAVSGNEQEAAEARNRAADALAKAQNIPVEDARTRVSQYEQQYRQTVDAAKQKATDAASVASKAVSRAALLGALALLLGGVAAWFGGRMGAVDPTITETGRVPLART